MRTTLFLSLIPLLTGCSTLQHYYEFHYSDNHESPQVTSSCQKPEDPEESVTVAFDKANELRLSIAPDGGFWFWGPPLIPFLPWWHSHHYLEVRIQASPGITFEKENWEIQSQAGAMRAQHLAEHSSIHCPSEMSMQERFDQSSRKDSLMDWRCSAYKHWDVMFVLPSDHVPEKFTLVMNKLKVNGVPQRSRHLIFKRSGLWKYDAVNAWNPQTLYSRASRCK